MPKERVLQPIYFEKFACTGSACPNNCCHDWGIVIDKATYLQYKKIKDPEFVQEFPNRIKRVRGETASDISYAKFVLKENGACPFQREDGLCLIHANFGPKYLCTTCMDYPRIVNQVDKDFIQRSLTMSCPEAVKLALLSPEPITFELVEKELAARTVYNRVPASEKLSDHLWILREACIDMMQNRSYPVADRLFVIGMLLKKVTELIDADQLSDIPDAVRLYSMGAEKGEFKGVLAGVADSPMARKALASNLLEYMLYIGYKNAASHRILYAFVQRLVGGIEFHGEDEPPENRTVDLSSPSILKNAYEMTQILIPQFFPDFLEHKSYILENYFVNYIFSTAFPLQFSAKGLNPYDNFVLLVEQYAIIRILLCCLAGEEGITDELLIHVLSGVSLFSQHSQNPEHVVKAYQKDEMDSLAHMSFLLRD